MADIIERLANYRQQRVTDLSDSHVKRLQDSLYELENQVIAEASKINPARGTLKLRTTAALELRPKLKNIIENTYLTSIQSNINEYDKAASWLVGTFKKYPIPEQFKEITELDLTTIQQLKRAAYLPFEDLGNEFANELAQEVYNSTLTGTSTDEMISNLRGKINGVYQSTDNQEAQELVDFIRDNPDKPEAIQTAATRLNTIYGRDRLGNNLRRYATQMVQDSLMGFDGQFAKYRADELGLTHYVYSGTTVRDSRDHCKKNVGKTFSEEEIRKIWSSTTWEGKAQGDPFIKRGGYNCRHHWQPTDPEWQDKDFEEPVTEIKKESPIATGRLSSLENPIQSKNVPIKSTKQIETALATRIAVNASDKRYPDASKIRFTNERRSLGKVSLKNLDDKTASHLGVIMDELDDLAEKFNVPKLRGVYTYGKRRNAIASMGGGVLMLNPRYFTKYVNEKKIGKSSKWKFGDDLGNRPHTADSYFDEGIDKMRTTLYHEFAHTVHQMKYVDKTIDYSPSYIPPVERVLARLRNRKSSTRYGDTNSKEWFAENFTLYNMNRKDLVDPKFINFIEEEM